MKITHSGDGVVFVSLFFFISQFCFYFIGAFEYAQTSSMLLKLRFKKRKTLRQKTKTSINSVYSATTTAYDYDDKGWTCTLEWGPTGKFSFLPLFLGRICERILLLLSRWPRVASLRHKKKMFEDENLANNFYKIKRNIDLRPFFFVDIIYLLSVS